MLLIVGPSGAGKTLLLKRLQNSLSSIGKDDVPATIPTVGTNLMNVTTLKKTEVTVREIGGAMAPIWNKYYKDASAIMFMIDLSRPTQVANAAVELMSLLSHPSTQTSPVLVILNKKDVPSSMKMVQIEGLFRLQELKKAANQKISVVETSAATGVNLEKVAKWLFEHGQGAASG